LNHKIALHWLSQGIQDSLRIMAHFVEGYQDINKFQTRDEKCHVPFMEYIKRFHRPPETVLTPEGDSVPLIGMMSLLAVGRCLADTDLLGGSGGNAGLIWIKDAHKITAAQVVKIDPAEAFHFDLMPQEVVSFNQVINTLRNLGHPQYHLQDLRNLQTSNQNQETCIFWDALSPSQKEEFLTTLQSCDKYLQSKEILHFLFYREGRFNRSESELIPEPVAHQLEEDMQKWMKLQLDLFYNKKPAQRESQKCILQ